jgi:uncharacterized repeat protein (TIGR01451 family)
LQLYWAKVELVTWFIRVFFASPVSFGLQQKKQSNRMIFSGRSTIEAFWKFAAAAALALAAMPLAAQQKAPTDPVEVRLESRKVVVGADGKESFAPGGEARPGDVLEYTATYRNVAKYGVKEVVATLPIPAQTEFVPGSARPANARASLDATTFAAIPLKRRVTRNGAQVEESVPYREYRSLRWLPVDLGSGASIVFTARVRVIQD